MNGADHINKLAKKYLNKDVYPSASPASSACYTGQAGALQLDGLILARAARLNIFSHE